MSGMFNIGLTGLNASQLALNTTSHNITNVNTPNFSRQRNLASTATPQFLGAGYAGQGTRVANIERAYDQFLTSQIASVTSRLEYYSSYRDSMSQVETLLADENAGLSSVMAEFFRGVNDVANNPTSIPARQALLSQGQALTGRVVAMNTRLEESRAITEGQIKGTVSEINSLATEIADLNKMIIANQASDPKFKQNDLLDRRDFMVSELSKLVGVSTYEDDRGSLNVFIGNGQSLVVGANPLTLSVRPDASDPQRFTLIQGDPDAVPPAPVIPDSFFSGGRLGALLAFRNETLDDVQLRMAGIVKSLAEEFNGLHATGFGLDNGTGRNFFSDLPPFADPTAMTLTEARELLKSFSINPNLTAEQVGAASAANEPSNNLIALGLAELQNEKIGTATLQSQYAQMVSVVGNKSRELQVAAKAQELQKEQAIAMRDSLSGVNLDEEAANLIRFQQSYQAAARVMGIAGTLFDEVLSIVR